MSAISIVLIAIVALLAGMEGILDEFQFHQPLVACTLIGLVTGHLKEGIILGGSLQMIALGWANVGAAVAPDAALASVASAIIMVLGLQGGSTNVTNAINTSIAVAVPLSVAGLFLTMICRTLAIPMVHFMDAAAEKGDYKAIERWQIAAILMQGLRIMIPAVILCFVPAKVVTGALNSMPACLILHERNALSFDTLGNDRRWHSLCLTSLTECSINLLKVMCINLNNMEIKCLKLVRERIWRTYILNISIDL